MALPMPELEGKYEILEKIREGGMGAIYKVRHRLLDEVRVIKVMRPSIDKNDELRAVDRFVREARIAIKLRHPNIAQLYDFSSDAKGNGFIVMEFIDGLGLDDILENQGPPSSALAVEIATQSLEALGALHETGFVHRDISPDNLMLTRDIRGRSLVKLIDLGIAKLVQSDDAEGVTKTGTFLGKYKYASPEMFQDAAGSGIDRRSDLYSFGIVLYELLTKEHPISGTDVSSVIAGHLFREPLSFDESDPDGKVPEELRAITLKALAKKPEERYQNAEEMVEALEEAQKTLQLAESTDEVQALVDLRDRLRAERADKPGTGTQAAFDDLFPAEETNVPSGDQDATVMLSAADADAANTEALNPADFDEGATRMMKTPTEGHPTVSAEIAKGEAARTTAPPAAAPAAGAAGKKFNPLLAVGAVVGLLAVVLVVMLMSGGDQEGAADPAEDAVQQAADTGTQGSAVEVAEATPIADLLAQATAAVDEDDWDLADEKLAEIDALTEGGDGAEPVEVDPDLENAIALLREDVLQASVERTAETLQAALDSGDRQTLEATISRLTPQEEQALVADPERAAVLQSARNASTAMARFERALDSSEPERALTIAFELASREPDLARAMNARERAASTVERRIDELMRSGDLRGARASAEALRQVWPSRRGLEQRVQRLQRMSRMSQRAESMFEEAERALREGQPHIGLQMLEGRDIPAPFRAEATQLQQRLRQELERRDRRPPAFSAFDEEADVTFEKGSPAVLRVRVTDDYEVLTVRARARNQSGEHIDVVAVPLGEGTYRVTIPSEFHDDDSFRFWAVAFDHSRNEGNLGASNRPIEIRRKRWFRRGRG